MRSLPRRLPASDKFIVFGAHICQEAHQKVEEIEVRVQNSHASLRSALLIASSWGSFAPCKIGCANLTVPSQWFGDTLRAQRWENSRCKEEGARSAWGARAIETWQWRRHVNELDKLSGWPYLLRPLNIDAWAYSFTRFPNHKRNSKSNGQAQRRRWSRY